MCTVSVLYTRLFAKQGSDKNATNGTTMGYTVSDVRMVEVLQLFLFSCLLMIYNSVYLFLANTFNPSMYILRLPLIQKPSTEISMTFPHTPRHWSLSTQENTLFNPRTFNGFPGQVAIGYISLLYILSWWRGVMVNALVMINKVTLCRARLLLG